MQPALIDALSSYEQANGRSPVRRDQPAPLTPLYCLPSSCSQKNDNEDGFLPKELQGTNNRLQAWHGRGAAQSALRSDLSGPHKPAAVARTQTGGLGLESGERLGATAALSVDPLQAKREAAFRRLSLKHSSIRVFHPRAHFHGDRNTPFPIHLSSPNLTCLSVTDPV